MFHAGWLIPPVHSLFAVSNVLGEERRRTSYLNWNVYWLGESRPFPPALPQHKQQDGWVLLVTTTCQNLHFRVTYACTSILTASDKLGVKSGKTINCLGIRNFFDFHWFSLIHRLSSIFDWCPSIFIDFLMGTHRFERESTESASLKSGTLNFWKMEGAQKVTFSILNFSSQMHW